MCPKPYATSVALFQCVEELKTGDSTHMWSHGCQRERDNPFCWPAWPHSDNTQDTVHLLHPHGTPLTHVQLGHLNLAQQHCLLASQQSACIAVHGLDTDFFFFPLFFVELHEVPVSSFLQPAQVPLNSNPNLQSVDCPPSIWYHLSACWACILSH